MTLNVQNVKILLNIKLNWPKLVHVSGYVLAINWQNFIEIYLA